VPDWSRLGFDWDEANEDHLLSRHGVDPEETEEVFQNHPHVRRIGDRYRALGRTHAGDLLHVIFVFRSGLIRVISARPMTSNERKSYDRNR
jgi:uncharacterized DUF497 family protein